MREKYNLTWHKYSDHLRDIMKAMMTSNAFTDVTLVCEDKLQIKAHKNILSACSPVFDNMLQNDRNTHSIIYLRGIACSDMESLLQFMYYGEATCYEERMSEFLNVAKSLEIKELSNAGTGEEEDIYGEEDKSQPGNKTEDKAGLDHIKYSQPEQKVSNIIYSEEKFKCEDCDKVFANKKGATQHYQSVHILVKFPCNQCNYQASQKVHLKSHIQAKHENLVYVCDLCEYKGKSEHSVYRHKLYNHKH